MYKLIGFFLAICTNVIASKGQSFDIPGPPGSGTFGSGVTLLPNGNYVVCDPGFDDGATQNVGAVYLYNGKTNALISTLKGSSPGDEVGDGGITVLTNGNYVISSEDWSNGNAKYAGAVTWGDANIGVSGVVNSNNSLVGGSSGDYIGAHGKITPLTNGNYVVYSSAWNNGSATDAGAVTWGNGNSGTSGVVGINNSLVGGSTDDWLGNGGITVLSNGNYIVSSPYWNNGTAAEAGAVTWGNGSSGTVGVVSSSNSLVGSSTYDQVGYKLLTGWEEISYVVITALTNGNYVVGSPSWDNGTIINAGAVTWGDGNIGVTGVITSSNSLTGNSENDEVGTGGMIALTNGNYVAGSYHWNNGIATKAGAVTWGNGYKEITGYIDSSNSLVGNSFNDSIGSGGITAFTNGNYVISSNYWDNGTIINAGAATWGNGITGIKGLINSGNSLVGNSFNDHVGSGGTTALTNGNYVVNSYYWNNDTMAYAGAVTWGNGNSGIKGIIGKSNSLVGNSTNSLVGFGGITPLTNGNYAVWSRYKNTVTWGNGSLGLTGVIDSTNSLLGNNIGQITALTNGNYVVNSSHWNNGTATSVGAVTWGNGSNGTSGIINSSNSLVGTKQSDIVGLRGIVALANGNYVIKSPFWDNGTAKDVGAVTWGNGNGGTTGEVSFSNSLVGSTADDKLGQTGITALSNGSYVVKSPYWDNGTVKDAGAVTLGNGSHGISGVINSCNSVLSSGAYGGFIFNDSSNSLIVGRPPFNALTLFKDGIQMLAKNLDTTTASIAGNNPVSLFNQACRLIATIIPDGDNPVAGELSAKVWVETLQPDSLVKRHFEITSAMNPKTSSAKIVLYFTQEEFDNYNLVNAVKLPSNSTDFQGIANLRIEKREGKSPDGTGLPSTYKGTADILNPDNSDVRWNNGLNHWEVSIDVVGFGGFFVKSSKQNSVSHKDLIKPLSVDIFPNPTNGKFNVRVAYNEEIHLSISSITGKLIMQQTIDGKSEFVVDLSKQVPGIYIARFSTGEVFKVLLL